MARNPKVELRGHEGQVVHPITDGDCVIFPSGETLSHKLSEQEEVMYAPEVTNSSPMFKVGEGDSSDYSANVLDGAYQEAVLKGQTYVNTIQEPSADVITLPTPFTEYERTQSKTFTEMQDGTFGLNLVGQSYVNCIQEPSEPSYVALGESLEFQEKKVEYTNEGQIKSAMLKGQTLVNLGQPQIGLHNNDYSYQGNASACVNYDEYIRYIPNGENNLCPCIRLHLKSEADGNRFSTKQPLKTNTKYIVFVKLNVQSAAVSKLRVSTTGYSNVGEVGSVVLSQGLQVAKAIFTTPTEFTDHLCVGTDLFWQQSQYVDLYWYQLFEYQEGMENWDIPYFEGMQSVTMATELENVCSRYNSSGAKNGKTFTVGSTSARGLKLSDVANIGNYGFKQNTKYLIQFKISNLNLDGLTGTNLYFSEGDISGGNALFGNLANATVRISKNGIYRVVLTTSNIVSTSDFIIKGHPSDWENSTPTSTTRTLTISQIMCIEYQNGMENWDLPYFETTQLMKPLKVQTHNDYEITDELYKEKITSALEPITLRAIENVKDTLDLSTGEYVQRIGEIVLDANTDKTIILQSINDNGIANFWIQGITFKANGKNICDKLVKQETRIADTTSEGFLMTNTNSLYIKLLSSKASTVDEFKTWLQTNPLKFQYELETPITRKISLEYPNLQTYQDITHVQSIAMDGTLIPKIFLPSDISYKAMLKPNTSYNVIVDREVIDSTNQLTVNLGGTTANITANRTVVTTPSTLSNETLTFSGKDNRLAKAMLIEGGTLIDGDLPHFDGIGDVKLGRVVENLCMSNEILVGSAIVTSTSYMDRIELKVTKAGSCVETFKLTKQLQNGKKYFVYCPYNINSPSAIPDSKLAFEETYNGSTIYTNESKSIQTDGKYILTLEKQVNPYEALTIGNHSVIPVNTTMTIRRPILCEYIDGMENWDWESIGYFTGTRNIGNEFMRIGNKNLFDSNNLVMGSCQYWGKEFYNYVQSDNRATMTELIKVKSGSTLTLKCNSNFECVIQEYISPLQKTKNTDAGWQVGQHILKLDEKTKYVNVYFRKIGDTQFTADDLNTLKNSIQLEEASSATSYVAHKHNSLHILPDKQIPLTFEQGATVFSQNTSFDSQCNTSYTNRIRTGLIDLEPNETYRMSCGNRDYYGAFAYYNNSNLGAALSPTVKTEHIFTTTKDMHKICINVARQDAGNLTPLVLHQVRLEKVTDVTLRSVGNVKDELDLTRGVYIQRIGEIVLNGSENWEEGYKTTNHKTYRLMLPQKYNYVDQWRNIGLINDKTFSQVGWFYIYNEQEKTDGQAYSVGDDNKIYIRIKSTDVSSFKMWLQQNPITVQYELKTPIEHKINIPMKNELNQTIAKPNGIFTLPLMHSETNHVDINSQIYPKVQSRDYISYPVIGNNSQLHTVFHNKLGTGNLTVNLCGTSVTSVDGTSKCTITTPSTISQYELRLSGARNKVSNVCVFSGDYMNVNVPYVQGMMNAVNPIVKNAGKNLFDGVVKNGEGWWDGKTEILARCRRSVNLTPVKPNTEYVFKLTNRYGIGCGANFMAHGKDGKFLKYIGWVLSDTSKFTTPSDCYYIHWYNDIDDFTDFYIEESSTLSQYEPYKENICEPHSEDIIALRSLPNGVRDELNLQTGEYIQRIGEVVLDGSEGYNQDDTSGDFRRFSLYSNITSKMKIRGSIVCDSFAHIVDAKATQEGVATGGSENYKLMLWINSSRLSTPDVAGLQAWLKQNPITVQYELETPIIKQIDINNFPHSYKDGHVIIGSNDPSTNVTAQMTCQCVANRTGQIQEHTEQIEKQEYEINELEMLILENIRQQQNR